MLMTAGGSSHDHDCRRLITSFSSSHLHEQELPPQAVIDDDHVPGQVSEWSGASTAGRGKVALSGEDAGRSGGVAFGR